MGNYGLTHSLYFLSGDKVLLKILTDVKRVLNANKVYIPFTDSVDLDITVVEYSAPEGTVYVTGKNLGEHALFIVLTEHAAILYNVSIVELNILRSKLNNINDYHNKRNDKPEEENSPKLKRGKYTLSCNDLRSIYIHSHSPFSNAKSRKNLLTTILYKNIL